MSAPARCRLLTDRSEFYYHFASKAALGEALIARYCERFDTALADLDATGRSAPGLLTDYAGGYPSGPVGRARPAKRAPVRARS